MTIPDWPPGLWFIDSASPADLIAFQKQETLVSGRSRFQQYEIFASPIWGKMLILDNRLQSAEKDEFIYHEALVHPALVAHPEPRRVLVLGGGEGATLREVLRHPAVEQAVMVDIDAELVDLCRRWLPQFHQGAFDDPRTELVCTDGRSWLAAQPPESFDVIVLDLPEPMEEGPARLLFTREMYALVRSRLAPRGMMALQSGSAGLLGRLLPDLHATLRTVFPRVAAYAAFVPSFMDLYGFQLAGKEDWTWPTAREAALRLASLKQASLRWLDAGLLAALPALPVFLQERLGQGRVLTDAAPFGPQPGERLFF